MSNKRNLLILVGSGSSSAVQMPSTDKLTCAILSDEQNPIIKVLKYINSVLHDFYGPVHNVTYEDLYHIVDQIWASYIRQYPNPIVSSFIKEHWCQLEGLLKGISGPYRGRRDETIEKAFSEIRQFIAIDIIKRLRKIPPDLESLSLYKDICNDNSYERIDIFILNHDLVLEYFLKKKNIKFNDGFKGKALSNDQTLLCWDYDSYKDSSNNIHIYKLHGSVDWIFQDDGGPKIRCKATDLSDFTTYDVSDSNGILIGNSNKILEYNRGIYRDLFELFHSRLRKSARLIICGYGFRDRGVNSFFNEWIAEPSNKAIVVNRRDKIEVSSTSFGHTWDKLISSGKLVFTECWLGEIDWPSLKGYL